MGPLAFLLRSFVLDVVLQSRPSSHLQHFVEIGHVPGEIGETVTLRFAQLAAHRGGSLSVFGSAEVTATAAMADAPGPVPLAAPRSGACCGAGFTRFGLSI